MTQVNFNGPATVTGFPRDKAFGFEVEGDALVIKAGKDVFLRIEKEPAVVTNVTPSAVDTGTTIFRPGATTLGLSAGGASTDNPKGKFDQDQPTEEQPSAAAPETSKTRKPRSPSQPINDGDVISVDPKLVNPYSKLRGKYFDTLQTANGRTVKWWEETSMVKSLEGSPRTMLRFFLTENVAKLVSGGDAVQEAPVPEPVYQSPPQAMQQAQSFPPGPHGGPVVPSFGGAPQQVAGAQWTPPGGQTPPGGATFM